MLIFQRSMSEKKHFLPPKNQELKNFSLFCKALDLIYFRRPSFFTSSDPYNFRTLIPCQFMLLEINNFINSIFCG